MTRIYASLCLQCWPQREIIRSAFKIILLFGFGVTLMTRCCHSKVACAMFQNLAVHHALKSYLCVYIFSSTELPKQFCFKDSAITLMAVIYLIWFSFILMFDGIHQFRYILVLTPCVCVFIKSESQPPATFGAAERYNTFKKQYIYVALNNWHAKCNDTHLNQEPRNKLALSEAANDISKHRFHTCKVTHLKIWKPQIKSTSSHLEKVVLAWLKNLAPRFSSNAGRQAT